MARRLLTFCIALLAVVLAGCQTETLSVREVPGSSNALPYDRSEHPMQMHRINVNAAMVGSRNTLGRTPRPQDRGKTGPDLAALSRLKQESERTGDVNDSETVKKTTERANKPATGDGPKSAGPTIGGPLKSR